MDQSPNAIETQQDLAAYIRTLAEWQWKGTPAGSPLNRYLEHLASYVEHVDIEELYARLGQPAPTEPSWKLFGQLAVCGGHVLRTVDQ